MTSRRLAGAGVDLVVTEAGDPAWPPAVVLHGVGSSADFALRALAAPLAGEGLRAVAYDLRGPGGSTPLVDPAEHRLALHVADLDCVVRATGARLVAGISLGAQVALAWAADVRPNSLDGLLACLPAELGPQTLGAEVNRRLAAEIRVAGATSALRRVDSSPGTLPWVGQELRRAWSSHEPASLAAAFQAIADEPPLAPEALAAIGVPVGIAAATDDPTHPLDVATGYRDLLPSVALETVSLVEVGADRTALGAAGVRAWRRAGLSGPR